MFTFEKTHYHIIKVYSLKYRDIIECLQWEDLPTKVAIKWRWYFEYRAALLKVKYPRHQVELYSGTMEPSKVQLERIKRNQEIARKGRITKLKNKIVKIELAIKSMRENWNELFPVEAHPDYNLLERILKNEKNKLHSIQDGSNYQITKQSS